MLTACSVMSGLLFSLRERERGEQTETTLHMTFNSTVHVRSTVKFGGREGERKRGGVVINITEGYVG